MENNPDKEIDFWFASAVCRELGHYDQSIEFALETVKIAPNKAKSYYHLSKTYFKKGLID